MNDTLYPFVGGHMRVDVRGKWGRAMKADAAHLAPEACRNCRNLCMSRDEYRNDDILHCSAPTLCHLLVDDCPPELQFVDVRPSKGVLSEGSPCWKCEHRRSSSHGPGGQLLHWCNRREKEIEHCVVRGTDAPEVYHEKKASQDSAQLEHELELIDMIDQTDYGTF